MDIPPGVSGLESDARAEHRPTSARPDDRSERPDRGNASGRARSRSAPQPSRRASRGHAAADRRDSLDSPDSEGPVARANELALSVAHRVEERPFTALAVALGVGFVVGGGLSFRAGRVAIAAMARQAARELLKRVL